MKFKFLEHTADIKFQAQGGSLEEAFENSALALAEVMTKKTKIKGKIKKKIKVLGKDNESLLYNFLEEFLFLFDSEGFVLAKIGKIKIMEGKLDVEVIGDKAEHYKLSQDVKAITYNNMFVKKLNQGSATPIKWVCQVVLDV